MEADFGGHEIFNVAAPTSAMREPTEELIRRFIPDLKLIKDGFAADTYWLRSVALEDSYPKLSFEHLLWSATADEVKDDRLAAS